VHANGPRRAGLGEEARPRNLGDDAISRATNTTFVGCNQDARLWTVVMSTSITVEWLDSGGPEIETN
jgi:hypothetical protein